MEEQFRHSAKLESLGILAGGIAHDFNNLLTGILANASHAAEAFRLDNAADLAVLHRIVEAAEGAAHLTRQMLAYSGKGSFLVRNINLSELVSEMSSLVQSSVPRSVYLRLELQSELPAIQADPGQIQQVVMNLIINGAEAIEEGTNGSVLVTTGVQMVDAQYASQFDATYPLIPGPYVSLEVHDTGSGMSEETQRMIFDPFFTTKVHGRGLGLSAVLGIMRGHKGGLRVYSEAGKGTTFKALFPVSQEKTDRIVEQAARPASRHSGHILVIDDDEIIGRTIRTCLERRGYSVALAHDGAAGIEMFKSMRDKVILVILDLTMPRMSGEETFRHLRQLRADVPVILSSGYNQVEATRKFVGKGLASFLQKPFTTQQLARAVEEASLGPSAH